MVPEQRNNDTTPSAIPCGPRHYAQYHSAEVKWDRRRRRHSAVCPGLCNNPLIFLAQRIKPASGVPEAEFLPFIRSPMCTFIDRESTIIQTSHVHCGGGDKPDPAIWGGRKGEGRVGPRMHGDLNTRHRVRQLTHTCPFGLAVSGKAMPPMPLYKQKLRFGVNSWTRILPESTSPSREASEGDREQPETLQEPFPSLS